MKLSDLNEYVQTAAAFGAILALVAVGYEIRQSNRIAEQQNISSIYTNLVTFHIAEVETGISSAVAKATYEPENLTPAEKIDLDSWLTAWIALAEHDYITQTVGNSPQWVVDSVLLSLAEDSKYYFGNKYARAWFEENTYWMSEAITKTVREALVNQPLGSDAEYRKRIDRRMEVMN
jgi:hypothetical protein